MLTFGEPAWTEGGFSLPSGLDDLGIEGVGGDLLRRLLPGVISTTSNAGYYSFFSYLHARWEDMDGSLRRTDFKPFFRRHEAVFVAACALHDHRGSLTGVAGITRGETAVTNPQVDVRRLADRYLKDAYGAYSAYYRGVLYDLRLTRLGEGPRVDRVTEKGRAVAEAFGSVFESTEYFRRYTEAESVPRDVLADLGKRVCLCTVPGRADHDLLVDAFFGAPEDEPGWERQRRQRVESLSMFLEFAAQRPEGVDGSAGTWRRCLLGGEFEGGSAWRSEFTRTREAWRAYQLREVFSLALHALWVAYLSRLGSEQPAAQGDVIAGLVDEFDSQLAGVEVDASLGQALVAARSSINNPTELISQASILERKDPHHLGRVVARALVVLLAAIGEVDRQAPGFGDLVDAGGATRWSSRHTADWFRLRLESSVSEVLTELIGSLVARHFRVATSKMSTRHARDPFCIGTDDGLQWVIRYDDPGWNDGRFRVVHHLLWTLGLLDSPQGSGALTGLGRSTLRRIRTEGA